MRSGTVENLHDFKGKLDKIKELKIFKKIYAVTLDKCGFICHFTFIQNCARIKKVVSCTKLIFPTNNRDASVAQWIERCPPEACAAVRLRSDAIG